MVNAFSMLLRNVSLPPNHEAILLYFKSFIVLSFTLRPENSCDVFAFVFFFFLDSVREGSKLFFFPYGYLTGPPLFIEKTSLSILP